MPAAATTGDASADLDTAAPRTLSPRRCLLLGLGFLAPLVVAHFLTPDPRGFGTHSQLWLPPCLLHTFTGVPCPFCGMTTAFAHLSHGQLHAGIACHPVGALLYVVCLLSGLGFLAVGFRRQPVNDPREAPWWRKLERVALGIVLAGWVFQLTRLLLR